MQGVIHCDTYSFAPVAKSKPVILPEDLNCLLCLYLNTNTTIITS